MPAWPRLPAGSAPVPAGDPSGSRGSESKYERLWDKVSTRDKRWAKKTAECESGGDPKAIGGGGMYRGAFQFLKSTWRTSPKSPGGDPIDYSYKTQAVVAVELKHRDGLEALARLRLEITARLARLRRARLRVGRVDASSAIHPVQR